MTDLLADAQGWLFETAVQPVLFVLGCMDWAETAFDWLGFALLGLVQMAAIYALCRPLEAWRPVARWDDRRAVWTDVLYTLLTRLGLLPLCLFVAFRPVQVALNGALTDAGLVPPTLETLMPWLRDHPLLALCGYVIVLDFGDYLRHRLQHALPWWWELHAVHHAQTRMTFWTDDRNHLLDDVLAAAWFGALALAIGVAPSQFPVLVLVARLVEALSHANARLRFGGIGERLLVSPRFHRAHHGILSAGASGRNYAVLLPVWDWLFGTADWGRNYPRTGVPGAPEAIVSGGYLQQQAAGLRGMWRALRRRPR